MVEINGWVSDRLYLYVKITEILTGIRKRNFGDFIQEGWEQRTRKKGRKRWKKAAKLRISKSPQYRRLISGLIVEVTPK